MKEGPNIKKEIMRRVKILYVLFFFLGICIFFKILYIQYGPEGDELRKSAEKNTFYIEMVDASRGEIVTTGGELLATSVEKYIVGIDFMATGLTEDRFKENLDGLAENLARFPGEHSKAGYKTMLQNGWNNRGRTRYLRIVSRDVSFREVEKLKTYPLLSLNPNSGGRKIDPVKNRVKPYGRLAGRTIGGVVRKNDKLTVPDRDTTKNRIKEISVEKGESGIEYSFESYLSGQHGWVLKQKIAEGFSVPVPESELNVEPVNGRDIVTTLDMDFQDVAEMVLERQILKNNAIWGTAVLMEVATGEIKAISNLTNKNGECVENYNYAIGQLGIAEPGSTFKLASMLALLEDGMDLDDPVSVGNGVRELNGGRLIRDDHKPENSTITLKRVFETSSNVGFVDAVVKRFGDTNREKDFVNYVTELGFDRPIGTGMAGEAQPNFHKPPEKTRYDKTWHSNSLAYMSHGYGFDISPLHTLTLYNAVANDGRMVRPILIREIREGGESVRKFATEVINPSIASPRTIAKVRKSLEGVVDEGTATVLKNPYYKVAAKTGTAQTGGVYGGGAGQLYLATMVGYFPADDPQYSCIVCIRTRYGSGNWNYYGGSLAGPVFKAIADRVYVTRHDWQEPVNKTTPRSEQPPAVKGGPAQYVKRAAKELDIRLADDTRKGSWARTSKDSVEVKAVPLEMGNGVMPAVTGMGLQDALFLLESQGLKVDFSGRGKVVSQFPKAGENIRAGATVSITLK